MFIKAVSLDERAMMVRAAFEALNPPEGPYQWVVDVYDTEAIVSGSAPGMYFRAPYTIQEGKAIPASRDQWEQVEKEWASVKRLDAVQVYVGDAVKALGGGRIGGYLVRYGNAKSTDLQGEYFTPETYFGPRDGDASDCLFHHGYPVKSGLEKLADHLFQPLKTKKDEIGIWAETVLNLADEYEAAVYQMVEAGKIGWSSGAGSHMVRKSADGRIVRWPIVEGSLTPAPAEYRNRTFTLKSFLDLPAAEDAHQPEATPEASTKDAGRGEGQRADPSKAIPSLEVKDMSEQTATPTTPAQDPAVKALDDKLTALSGQFEKMMKFMEDSPAIKNSGYITHDGGRADPGVKSMGDFCKAVARHDVARLNAVYNTGFDTTDEATKTLETTDGGNGGFVTVPPDYSTSLFQLAQAASPFLARIERIGVGSASGKWPTLDQYITPTAGVGQTALAAGVKPTKRGEGASYTETEPDFELLSWAVNNIGGLTKVTIEMMQDTPQAVEALLRQLFALAIAAKEEFYLFRGTGAGMPLGILNSPAAIGISPDTNSLFAYEDAVEMFSRFKSVGGQPQWAAHQSILPDLATFRIGTGSPAGVPLAFLGSNTLGNTMPGVGGPVAFSEHLPQADNAGCVILYDPNAYKFWVKGGLRVAYSEHRYIDEGKVAWVFDERIDGKPLLKGAVTQGDPQGSFTVSPFVYFND